MTLFAAGYMGNRGVPPSLSLGSRGFRESLDIGHSYVQQGIELGPNFIFLGASDVAEGAFVQRFRFGSRSLWLMMIEICLLYTSPSPRD